MLSGDDFDGGPAWLDRYSNITDSADLPDAEMTLQERLTATGYITDGTRYEMFQPGSGKTFRVSLPPDGSARISAFDGQMSWKWSADFTADVADALILNFLDTAEMLG